MFKCEKLLLFIFMNRWLMKSGLTSQIKYINKSAILFHLYNIYLHTKQLKNYDTMH